jgi:hypothetical protein
MLFGNMLTALVLIAFLCSVTGVGMLIYSEVSTDNHNSFFCFCVGVGMGSLASMIFLAAMLLA